MKKVNEYELIEYVDNLHNQHIAMFYACYDRRIDMVIPAIVACHPNDLFTKETALFIARNRIRRHNRDYKIPMWYYDKFNEFLFRCRRFYKEKVIIYPLIRWIEVNIDKLYYDVRKGVRYDVQRSDN